MFYIICTYMIYSIIYMKCIVAVAVDIGINIITYIDVDLEG